MPHVNHPYVKWPSKFCQGCGRESPSLPQVIRRWGSQFKFCSAACAERFTEGHQTYGDYFDSAAG